MTAAQVWYLVSDLHLGTRKADPRGVRLVFARFVDGLAEQDTPAHQQLVLLGDLFDLGNTQDPVTRLMALADHNRTVFQALGAAIDAGLRVHVVCGNHDLQLARPEVWDTWVSLLGVPSAATRVQLHPWFLHVPGVVYAEHGHQQHPLSRTATLLDLCSPVVPQHVPDPPLLAWTAGADQGLGHRLLALSVSLGHARSAERRVSSPSYTAQLARQSAREDLPLGVVQELVRMSRFRVAGAALSVARRRVVTRLGLGPGDVLSGAAARVSETLTVAGRHVPAIVFGHVHRAGLVALGAGSTYANCGTWTDDVRGPGPDAQDPRLFPVVVLDARRPVVEPVISYWNSACETWHHQSSCRTEDERQQPGTRSRAAFRRGAKPMTAEVPSNELGPTRREYAGTRRSQTDDFQDKHAKSDRDPGSSLAGCRRILVLGRTGSGKTTLARELAAVLEVPHVELDALYFGPGFSTAPLGVLRERTTAAIAEERWVTDGNKQAVRDLVWPRADTVIWLDYPLVVSLWRLGKRALWRTSVIKTEVAESGGSATSLRRQLVSAARGVVTALRSHRGQRREYPRMFERPENEHLTVLRLRSPWAARRWMARVLRKAEPA